MSLKAIVLSPDKSHGPRTNLTWTIPAEPNGVIRSYTVSYSHSGNSKERISGIDALHYTVDVLGGVTYQFNVRAVTIKPGPNASSTVDIPEYSEFRFSFKAQTDWCFVNMFVVSLRKNSVYTAVIHLGS